MRQMLSDTTLRKLHLIEYLDLLTHPIDERQLAEDLAVSRRTLMHDIQQINNDYDFLMIYKTHQGFIWSTLMGQTSDLSIVIY